MTIPRIGWVGIFTGAAVLAAALAAPPAVSAPPTICDGQPATLVGTDGDDVLEGTVGPDVVSLGDGNDRFDALGGDDVVCGGPGSDELRASDGDDRVFGEDGVDRIFGVLGDDLLDGGPGNDELWDDSAPIPLADGDGADELLGGDGDDSLHLSGGDGLGGGGVDHADGGPGARDSIGFESSPVGVTVDVAAGTGSGDAVDTFASVERSYAGSEQGDTLIGTPGDDVLHAGRAGSGTDHVLGFGGDDVLGADSGIVRAGAGNDVFDFENGSGSHLDVHLGQGNDRARIWDGRAIVMRGGRGHDAFDLNTEGDLSGFRVQVLGGSGADRLSFWLARRIHVDLRAGEATFSKSRLRLRDIDEVVGSSLSDTLLGGPRADVFRGGGGDDVLRGRDGADVLIGDLGRDAAFGGRGSDTCVAEVRRLC